MIFAMLGILFPCEALGQQRVIVEPSLEIAEVHDNNLFYSSEDPVDDLILRVTPSMSVRMESPRWLLSGSYGFDSERFATHQSLDETKARERALLNFYYRADPRLELGLEASYLDTATAAEFNVDTGVAAARIRGRSLNLRPSLRYQLSPRVSARATHVRTTQSLSDGSEMRGDFGTLEIERRFSPRDRITLDYTAAQVVFDFEQHTTTDTHVLRAGWSRDLDARTRLELHAGPRLTNDSLSPEISASLSRQYRFSSMTLSYLKTQSTLVGQPGIVDSQQLQASLTYAPSRSLRAYASPAIFHSAKENLEAVVYRMSLGVTHTLTPLLGIDVSYQLDKQEGVLDSLRPNEELSHGTLLVALRAHRSGT